MFMVGQQNRKGRALSAVMQVLFGRRLLTQPVLGALGACLWLTMAACNVAYAAAPVPQNKPDILLAALDTKAPVQKTTEIITAPKAAHIKDGADFRPMSDKTIRQYRRIFALQEQGRMDRADLLIKDIGDERLMGYVLYQRYLHPTAYTTSFKELKGWMDLYADHAGADRIYKLATLKRPKGDKSVIVKPSGSAVKNGYLPVLADRAQAGSAINATRIEKLSRTIRADLARGAPSAALRQLERQKSIAAVDYDYLRAEIARGYMLAGKLKTARDLAQTSLSRSGAKIPNAGWVGGLSAWRLKDYKNAALMFEKTAHSPHATPWVAAGAAYWASRAHMRAGNVNDVNKMLELAASYPRTFYGLIATRALGWDFDFNWSVPSYNKAHAARLSAYDAFQRADLLVRTGQFSMAEAELRRIDAGANPDVREALIAYATRHDLPAFAMRLAEAYHSPGGGLYDAALYPLAPWKPEGGYKIDRALILALIRQESRFNPEAQSRSGATGLMQLMPATASFVSGIGLYRDKREGAYALKNPQTNMAIGQNYVEDLLEHANVDADLMSLLIAYNAGPGNLRKWKRELSETLDDPLLFIETIPMGETRNYVERVMANYWIYRLRLDQPATSLDAVAEGGRAEYAALDHLPAKRPLVLALGF